MSAVPRVLPSAEAAEGARALDEVLTRLTGGRPVGDYAVNGVEDAWKVLRSGGWDQLAVPEADGGFGLPLRDLAEFAQLVGSHLMPVPVTTSIVLRGQSGSEADDTRPLGAAIPRRGDPARARVVFGDYPGVWVVNLPADANLSRHEAFDPTLRMAVTAAAPRPLAPEASRRLSVLWAAESAGAAGMLLREAVAYAKVREQFGQPIGRFQAIKHLLADCHLAQQEALTAIVWAANEAALAPSALRLVARRCLFVSENATQVFGGIGMTWELGLHFYTRHIAALGDLTEDLLAFA
ncbi:MAG: acyl-CoA dehydrogenase [Pseudonocardiaceae bacterium]|nr:acyl-CoA dehydrogenase [Pseudonocardiaceae bacterium]